MRKVRILAAILVLSLMLTGAAYALWNQSITVTSQATMGEMDVQISCASIARLSTMPGLGFPNEFYFDAAEPTVAADNHSVTFSVSDVYPGAKYGLNFTIKNTGDVPAEITDVAIDSSYPALFALMDGSFSFVHMRQVNGIWGPVADDQTIYVPQCDLANLGAAIEAACSGVILYPGDELIPVYGPDVPADWGYNMLNITIDESISGNDYETQGITIWTSFGWTQCDPTQYGY